MSFVRLKYFKDEDKVKAFFNTDRVSWGTVGKDSNGELAITLNIDTGHTPKMMTFRGDSAFRVIQELNMVEADDWINE